MQADGRPCVHASALVGNGEPADGRAGLHRHHRH
ncbi:MAG: hypothetical protein ACE5E7_15495 [Anaerolineae bacterium]